MAASRGASFEHAKGTACTDAKFHRHCQGRWRGSVSLGFDAQGKRIRRRVTGRTKTECLEATTSLREELSQAPKSSRKYTVAKAFEDWLANGLPGRSENTKGAYRSAAGPLVERIGHRPLRELTSSEVRIALDELASRLSTRTLTIARQSLERTVRFAMNHDRVSARRNQAGLDIEAAVTAARSATGIIAARERQTRHDASTEGDDLMGRRAADALRDARARRTAVRQEPLASRRDRRQAQPDLEPEAGG
jgi:hypothetical protein